MKQYWLHAMHIIYRIPLYQLYTRYQRINDEVDQQLQEGILFLIFVFLNRIQTMTELCVNVCVWQYVCDVLA